MFHIRYLTRAILVQVLISVVATLLAVATPLAALSQERVALVIGNSKYQNARPLLNARNDGIDMMDMLSGLGFDVLGGTDLSYDEMSGLIRQFAAKADNAEIAMVFFAGHGVQADGRNYLIPSDARLVSDRDLAFQAIDMAMLMAAVERSRFGVILLDACRDNPFVTRMAQSNPFRNLGNGLARADIQPRSKLLVGYATHPGGLADDGDSTTRNSPYTKALLNYLPQDMDLYRVLAHVAEAVSNDTRGQQNPWLEGNPPLEEIRLTANATTARTLVPEGVTKINGTVNGLDPEPQPCSNCGSAVNAPDAHAPDPTPQNSTNIAAPLPNSSRVTRCDELAANPEDENKLPSVVGVSKADILWELAIRACQEAVATWPDVARLKFQLGRALESAGRYAEAHAAYLAAAEDDYAHALTNIGDMYRNGLGVEQNQETAFRWHLRAGNLGSGVAYSRLSAAYADGRGTKQNFHEAAQWFLRCAENGSSYAMYWLGSYYLASTPEGGDDKELGIHWLKQAANLGETRAEELLHRY